MERSDELKELTTKAKEAHEAYYKLFDESEKWIAEETRKIREQAREKWDAELKRLYAEMTKTETERRKAWNEHLVGESKEKLPYPEGTILRRKPEGGDIWYTSEINKMGKQGVLEIFREGDDESLNRNHYHRPPVGAVVVRALLKDGKKGKHYVVFSRTKEFWEPEIQKES